MFMYYPGGAGGNFVSHLICVLQHDDYSPYLGVNYHLSKRDSRIITHDHASFERTNPEKDLVIGGNCIYNFYVNFVIKWAFHDEQLHEKDHYVQVIKLSHYVDMFYKFYAFFQSCRPHLEWTLMYTDEDKFIDDLFELLEKRKYVFRRNRELAKMKIAEYKATNIDPMDSFDNPDSILWQAWCIDYMRNHRINSTFKVGMPSRNNLLMIQAKKIGIAEQTLPFLFKIT